MSGKKITCTIHVSTICEKQWCTATPPPSPNSRNNKNNNSENNNNNGYSQDIYNTTFYIDTVLID